MKKINDINLLNEYFDKYNIKRLFNEEIINYAHLHFYEKDEFILEAESKHEYYYLLVDGKVKISHPFENGKSMFLKFYKDFNTIGDLELLKNIPVRCNVEAVENTYLIGIPSNILRKKYIDNIGFLHHLIDSLSEKLDVTINNASYNFIYPLTNRLASYLVEHLSHKNYVILNSSFKEISEFLGTTYRHLNRTFKELEAKSIIRCEDKKNYIMNEGKLRELSKKLYVKSL